VSRTTLTTRMPPNTLTNLAWTSLLLAWLLALASMLGSLFFSDVMNLAPCVLCWWQRIFMFPLVFTLGLSLFTHDHHGVRYSLVIAAVGWLIALYHFLLYTGFIPKGMQPCGPGLSCSEISFQLWGFMTIPLMSLLAFTALIVLMFASKRESVHEK
jgi:disulfide bond formation protein DsbB